MMDDFDGKINSPSTDHMTSAGYDDLEGQLDDFLDREDSMPEKHDHIYSKPKENKNYLRADVDTSLLEDMMDNVENLRSRDGEEENDYRNYVDEKNRYDDDEDDDEDDDDDDDEDELVDAVEKGGSDGDDDDDDYDEDDDGQDDDDDDGGGGGGNAPNPGDDGDDDDNNVDKDDDDEESEEEEEEEEDKNEKNED